MKNALTKLPGRPELALMLVLIGIVLVLVMPLSRTVLDVLTVISMSSCLMVLLMSVRVQSPVQLLTFPALLLITTMLRLSLNVASTKMILLDGRAGHVIETFGRIVMGGNLLVGLSVFAIVSLVQFLVVAKGADRVAEVGARFSLDAMPGKQMSIDGDLRAGTLTAEQASQRRDRLDIESRFFGGMDGAMKFVKGDAVAGLVIALVNIVGGMASGMAYHGMSASVALHRYSALSVGDAMVSQIPSFMIAVAAGLITTRVTSSQGEQSDLGGQILGDLRRHPLALMCVGGFCTALALVPGFPWPVFSVLGLALIGGSWLLARHNRLDNRPARGWQRLMPSFRVAGSANTPPFIDESARAFEAPLAVMMSRSLAERIDPQKLDEEVGRVREHLIERAGAPFPGLACGLEAGEPSTGPGLLRWLVAGSTVATLQWRDDAALDLGAADVHADGPLGLPGFPQARWIEGGPAGAAGIETCVARVVEHLCRREPARLLTHEQFHDLMRELREAQPQLAESLAAVIPLPTLTEVIRLMLREDFTLRMVPAICDSLVAMAPLPQDACSIAEQQVAALSRWRCRDFPSGEPVRVHRVNPGIESLLERAGAHAVRELSGGGTPDHGTRMPPDVDAFREVRQALHALGQAHPGGRVNLVCGGSCRLMLSQLAQTVSPRLRVFSYRGIHPRLDLEIVSTLDLSPQTMQRLAEQDELLLAAGTGLEDGGGLMDLDIDGLSDMPDDDDAGLGMVGGTDGRRRAESLHGGRLLS
jgi:type III secretion protein V